VTRTLPLLAVLLEATAPARAGVAEDVTDALAASLEETGRAAVEVALDDRPAALQRLEAATDALNGIDAVLEGEEARNALGHTARRTGRRLERFLARLRAAAISMAKVHSRPSWTPKNWPIFSSRNRGATPPGKSAHGTSFRWP